jgi:adenosylhomocysteine nucleosidase
VKIGFVTGLVAEAQLLSGVDALVATSGGTVAGVTVAAEHLVDRGADVLISFGLAGGLAPSCRAGDLIVPQDVVDGSEVFRCDPGLVAMLGGATVQRLTGAPAVVASRTAKAGLYAGSGAAAVDLESVGVARVAVRHAIGFAVLRAVVDPAHRALPDASLVALDEAGRIAMGRIIRSLARNPLQISGLIALGRDMARAKRTLKREVTRRFRT